MAAKPSSTLRCFELIIGVLGSSLARRPPVAKALITAVYWAVPHELTSNLQRQILELQLSTAELTFRGQNPLDRVPGASGTADIVFWFAYVVVICVVLTWLVRRKQV